MELKSLNIFRRVAECGSLTRAAEILSLQQSAVSRDIRLLERRLGIQLFHRHGRGVELTKEGQAFLTDLLPHLEGIDLALQHVQQRQLHTRTALRLIWTAAHGLLVGAHVVQRFHRHFPHVQFKVTSGSSEQVQRDVEAGVFDIGFLNNDRPFTASNQRTLMKAPLFLVCRRDAARERDALSASSISFRQAAAYPLMLWSPQNALRRVVDQHAIQNRIDLNIFTEIEEYGTIADLVINTDAAVILPKTLMDQRLVSEDFLVRTIGDPSFRYYYGVIFSDRRSKTIDFVYRSVLTELKKAAAADPDFGEMVE